jgi:asparagine synthase (glutamine-hydrolysing)
MCGITGFLERPTRPQAAQEAIARAMTAALAHRGPDDAGIWTDADAGVALGHRRLAIIDVSPLGHQPMSTADGRYIVTYNGEIYNYDVLAARLRQAGVILRGRSDTEVLIEAFARWGVRETLVECEGMFAIALWDREARTLTLARDRLGIKPLYWSNNSGHFLFASELKALHQHPDWQPAIDPAAIASYLRFGYVPAPHSIYRDTYKLEPGALLTVSGENEPHVERYWDLREIVAQRRPPSPGDDFDQLAELDTVLRRAVRNEMVSDVPLGAFLSGGIDSSLVTALMQVQSSRPVRTFSIGFSQEGYDEAAHAKRVAAHLGTEHTEFYVEDAVARDVIPQLPEWYDEPFADSSQIPTQVVSRLARQHVTVALSGDGGDELFGGYTRHRLAEHAEITRTLVPQPLRRVVGYAIDQIPAATMETTFRWLPARLRPVHGEQKLAKLAALIGEADAEAAYRRLVSLWPEPERLVPGASEPQGLVWDKRMAELCPNVAERMMLLDALTYLPDDILTKVDRASMSVALEVRVPLLNHRVVELAWRLPLSMKLRRGTSKWALRQLLHRHVPEALIDRPKQGFSVPLAAWLRGPLARWADDLLSHAAIASSGWLAPSPILERWREHRRGLRDWSQSLWAVLMLQSWLAQERQRATVRPANTAPVRVAGAPAA